MFDADKVLSSPKIATKTWIGKDFAQLEKQIPTSAISNLLQRISSSLGLYSSSVIRYQVEVFLVSVSMWNLSFYIWQIPMLRSRYRAPGDSDRCIGCRWRWGRSILFCSLFASHQCRAEGANNVPLWTTSTAVFRPKLNVSGLFVLHGYKAMFKSSLMSP